MYVYVYVSRSAENIFDFLFPHFFSIVCGSPWWRGVQFSEYVIHAVKSKRKKTKEKEGIREKNERWRDEKRQEQGRCIKREKMKEEFDDENKVQNKIIFN